MIKNPLAKQRQWMAFFLFMIGLPCIVHPAWGSDKMEVGDVLQKSEKRSIPARRAGIDNTFATSLMAAKGLRLDQPDIRAACQRLAEQDKVGWEETWEAWHELTTIKDIVGILAEYLEGKKEQLHELRLNEWMRYWYVYNHISQPSQQSLADISVWEWMKNEERLSEELINPWPAAAMLLAERVKISPSFRERLIKQLMDSKADGCPAITRIAAANALTILHTAGPPFSRIKDLQGIQVAVEDTVNDTCEGPNLVGAMLSGADLRGADLRGAHLQKACLNQTCMAGAKLEQVCFGSPYDDGPDDRFPSDWQAGFPALQGHTNLVLNVSCSPDGKWLASASQDRTLRMWDVMTGACLRTLPGHGGPVNNVSFSPDGSLLASASDDKTICIWDTRTGAWLRTLEGHTDDVTSVSFSPDGSLLASASSDKLVHLWNVKEDTLLRTFSGHTEDVFSVQFSPDGRLLASASSDKLVHLWDVGTDACLRTFTGHTQSVESVSFSPDGRLLASASQDTTLRMWDPRTDACLRTLAGHTGGILSVSFSPDSTLLASASRDKTLRMWDTRTGACFRTLQGHTDGVCGVIFSPDGSLVASASYDKTLRIWEVATGHVRHILGSLASRSLDVHGLCIHKSKGLELPTSKLLIEHGAKDPTAAEEDEKKEEA